MEEKNNEKLLDELKMIKRTLQHLLAIELYKSDVKHAAIGKHLSVSTVVVGAMLKGVNKEK